VASDRCRRLSLWIQDGIQPVLDDLLSDLPVPIDMDRVDHDAEAPKVAGRKNV
jgi:hypothetical protein